MGKGRFGADELQRAAIQEQRQNAADNPIAAAMATSSASGQQQNNAENLLDIDFDGSAPASQEGGDGSGGGGSGMADMMGLFDAPAPSQAGTASAPVPAATPVPAAAAASSSSGGAMDDLLNGFGGLQFGGSASEPAPAGAQLHGTQAQGQAQPAQKKDSEDLLGLF